MTPSFNLIDRPWIPCHLPGSPRLIDLSLRDVLTRAHEIVGLTGDSPLETVAIHRLLLAILHANFDVRDEWEWAEIWKRASFDASVLESWAERERPHFDLFDPERPFYQTPGLPESSATTMAKLGHAFSAGNNAILFDHSWDEALPDVPAPAAARLLLAYQAFAIGGLIGRLPGDPPSAEAAHLVKAAVILNTGTTLFETLLLNMVRVDGAGSYPFPFDPAADSPAWLRPPAQPVARPPDGYLDLLTWQSRRVLLFPSSSGETVSRMALMAGYSFVSGTEIRQAETMVAYIARPNTPRNMSPWSPVGFNLERALWRDSAALLQSSDSHQIPANLRWLRELQRMAFLDRDRVFTISAFGLSSEKAKVFLWRAEELPLPLAYLREPRLVDALTAGLAAAEQAARALRFGVRILVGETLGPGGTADKDRVTGLVDSLAPLRAFWPALDLHFRTFMLQLAREFDADDGTSALRAWSAELRMAAAAAFQRACAALETESRGYRAAAEAAPRFFAQLGEALQIKAREEVPA